ncbi:DNA ligase 1 isoform X2 [Corythoichthys intestinalis]|uniref:DNA ligase 1 isoform X2 n=1 Tax=Corythoichthys intestinalis TaxID=161448 RepID=UPI0025A517AE|nr:DNA ligase 1 isoform X2 [Corythoichthys intestinalis]
MQRSIASFFQPKIKDKDVQKTSKVTENQVKKPVKSPLKAQNGVVEDDSPVKKIPKRSRRILDSDEEDNEEVVHGTKQQVKDDTLKAVPTPMSPPPPPPASKTANTPVTPVSTNATSTCAMPSTPVTPSSSMSPGTPNSVSSSGGTSKRKTARKMFPKRKFDDSHSGSESQKEEEAASMRTPVADEGQRSKRARVDDKEVSMEESDDEVAVEQQVKMLDKEQEMAEAVAKKPEVEKKEDDSKDTKEPTEEAKKAPISSFFAPRKAALNIDKMKSETEKPTAMTLSTGEDNKDAKIESTDTDYNPSRSNYHPLEHACWKEGQKVPYLAVARTFERIEEDSGRLRNIETLANLFRSVLLLSPDDLLCCVYLCLNQLGPAYLGMELGIGETVLMKAVAQATGRQLDKIKAEAQERGDLGLVAESSRSNQRTMFRPASLTVGGVFKKLKEIASMSGNSAMNKKIDIIKGLFVACRFSEARYIVRSLAGKLRIGLAEQSVLSALSQAVCLTTPQKGASPAIIDAGKGMSAESRRAWIEEKSLILKQTYCEMPNYDILIPVLLKEGIDQLPNHCKLTPGVPLRPMLAHPTKGVGEVMKRFDEAAFTCEYKYDGERAQIHILEGGEVRIFSRNQEDNTSKYPDIISRIPKVKKESVVSCVLDSEAVAWDREKKQIQPFQVLTTRKRKDVDASDIKVQVCVYAFDLLYLNGESLVRQPLCRRRELLRESFAEVEGEFLFASYLDSDNTEAIAEFLEQSVRDSCEGLMVKTLEKDATYEIAKRSHNWLKLKKDYLEGVGDTVDLCVIGAYLGKGKRTGTYGGFLLACYDEENEEFQSVCKIGTGFKDEDLEQHHKFLKEHILPKPRPYYRVDQSAEPDVWLDAVQVWEVKCADLSLSPVYKAAMGMVDPVKGISLRFPRFLRIREDKKPEDATSGVQIADLYKKQQQIQNQGDKVDMEDYY